LIDCTWRLENQSAEGRRPDPSDGPRSGSRSGAGRVLFENAPGRFWPPIGQMALMLWRRQTRGANCPAALGTAFEVTAFDGGSLRSPARTALETRSGWISASRARPHFPMIGRIPGGFSRHWKKLPPVFQALEKRVSGQAARSRDVQERQSGALSKLCGRPDRTACALFLSGGPCGVAARLAASSAATAFLLFARAPTRSPPKAGGKSAAERREVGERLANGRRAEARRSSRGPFRPA